MSDKLPGKGVFGWLGRQVGYVRKSVKAKPITVPPAKHSASQSGSSNPTQPTQSKPPAPDPAAAVLYRQGQIHEAEHPTQPGVKLRRTIIDEVIVDPGDDPEAP